VSDLALGLVFLGVPYTIVVGAFYLAYSFWLRGFHRDDRDLLVLEIPAVV